LNDWIVKNYTRLKQVCDKFNIGIDTDDLCQCCIEQFLLNEKVKEIPDAQKLFYFTRIVKNNAASNSSPFYYEHRKFSYVEVKNDNVKDFVEETNEITLDWVYTWLEEYKKVEWYYGRLFELYLDEGCSISKTSQRTTIPLNSVSRDINKVRKLLRQARNKKLE
jgi:hypothetical protein